MQLKIEGVSVTLRGLPLYCTSPYFVVRGFGQHAHFFTRRADGFRATTPPVGDVTVDVTLVDCKGDQIDARNCLQLPPVSVYRQTHHFRADAPPSPYT